MVKKADSEVASRDFSLVWVWPPRHSSQPHWEIKTTDNPIWILRSFNSRVWFHWIAKLNSCGRSGSQNGFNIIFVCRFGFQDSKPYVQNSMWWPKSRILIFWLQNWLRLNPAKRTSSFWVSSTKCQITEIDIGHEIRWSGNDYPIIRYLAKLQTITKKDRYLTQWQNSPFMAKAPSQCLSVSASIYWETNLLSFWMYIINYSPQKLRNPFTNFRNYPASVWVSGTEVQISEKQIWLRIPWRLWI